MGIALKEGDYALQNNGGKKTVIQLKLTDSALRAIEIFQEELVNIDLNLSASSCHFYSFLRMIIL